MTTTEHTRENLLVQGLGRPVALNAVDWKIKHDNPSASVSDIQDETLGVIRALVDDGLFTLGSVRRHRFVSSRRSLNRSMHRISHQYVDHYDDPKRWMFSAWMKLTNKGQRLAQSLEQRAIDSYRDSWAGSDRCENVLPHDFSTHDIAELRYLRAEIAQWQTAGAGLIRDVA
ncbi:hypothetical protein PT015_00480 [Candidatus Mycobacterium wuenschmannii]|uniref:Uncharacterized protein n=1 Tax=Candidatus Mycobacterium wuenschmannii TaxID=3027808 RepID=A0ABY8VZ98_9MYCO|nr:hypothetical protein [Candidatus Mycobacterium wuenschmannii]WIM88047.1 hypothetical protein PT015_00480 [Candidatus Mycobacterium wuenschmannii]